MEKRTNAEIWLIEMLRLGRYIKLAGFLEAEKS